MFFHDTNTTAAVDALCRLRTCSQSCGAHPLILRNTVWRQPSVLRSSRRHFPALDTCGVHRPENDGWRAEKGFLEGGSFGMPSLDAVYDLRFLHLCVRELCDLHFSRFNASASKGRHGASAGSTAWLLRPLDGVLFVRIASPAE